MINPSRIIGAIGLTGGSGKTLDSYPSNMMKDGDSAVVIDNSNIIFYTCDVDSGLEENVPFVIKPDDIELSQTNNYKRWILASVKYFTDDIIQSLGHYIETSKIKAIQNETLRLISADGQEISIAPNGTITVNNVIVNGQILIDTNERRAPFIVDSSIKVDKLNADKLDGYDADKFVMIDGSNALTGPLGGVDPIDDSDLTTKGWVNTFVLQIKDTIYSYIDDQIAAIDIVTDINNLQQQINNHLSPSSDDHIQYAHLDGRRNFTGPIGGVTPTLSEHFTTKGYLDTVIDNLPVVITDHSNLENLSNDDHQQYIHIDSRRGFLNPVSGKTPLTDFHLATKEYVDERIANIFHTKKLQIHTFDHITSEWVINHNFNDKYIVADFYEKFTNKQIKPVSFVLVNSNTAIAYFSENVQGYAVVSGIVQHYDISSASNTWVIEHTFLTKHATFNIFNENDNEIFPDTTTIVDDTHISFTFNAPQTGTAVLSNDISVFNFSTPSTQWTVFHTYNNKNLLANCFNQANIEIVPKDIEATDDNTLLITFEYPQSGYVIVSGSEAVILDPGLFIINHTDLRKLNNDDHLQYAHLDGRRGFTDVISGVYPLQDDHLVTKKYVDDGIDSILNGGLVVNHSDLGGLDQDDHTQYSLVDGTRDFTGPIKGVDPTNAYHLATKHYVDAMLNASNSSIQKGTINLVNGADNITIGLSNPLTNYNVELTLENLIDVNPSMYSFIVIRKTLTEFDVSFSGYIDSDNYKLNWVVYPLS